MLERMPCRYVSPYARPQPPITQTLQVSTEPPYTYTESSYTYTEPPYTYTESSYTYTEPPYTYTELSYIYTKLPYTYTKLPYIYTELSYTYTKLSYTYTELSYTHTEASYSRARRRALPARGVPPSAGVWSDCAEQGAGMILALDLGTTAVKAAVVSARGELLAWDAEPQPLILTPDGGVEQDPRVWWATLTRLVQRLLSNAPEHRDAIRAVSCTAQWSGTVAVDASGEPLGNAILWMDTRGAPDIADLIGGFPSVMGYNLFRLRTWLRLTGGAPARSGKDPLAHILYLRRADPERYRAAHKFLEPKDYLNLRLTGRFASTYETLTLHWLTDNRDIRRVDYHPTLLRYAGLRREQFPDLYPSTAVLGTVLPTVADEWGLPRGVQVIAGTPDLHATAIGSGGLGDFQAHLALSTSAWISCHVPFKRTDIWRNIATLPAGIPGRYFIANEQESAGACLNWLCGVIWGACPPPDAYAQLEAWAAQAAAGANGLRFLPWLVGERTPVENPHVRGGFCRLSLQHGRPELARAVLEGVALNARWLLQAVERLAGRRLEPIRLIGGGAHSAIWAQILADVLQRELWQMAQPQMATVRGVGMLAAVAMGYADWQSLERSCPVQARFTPDPERARLYDALYREFRARYRVESRRWAS
jgi:xylulokinase